MGTRNLTMVQLNGKIRVAQYCQWDGYPSGQGETVLKFLKTLVKTPSNLEKFKQKIDATNFISQSHCKNIWELAGADSSGLVSMDLAEKVGNIFPQLSRNTGAEILKLILTGKVSDLYSDIDFAADSLFCEWAYLIDLDNEVLEVYRGFVTSPLKNNDRFKYLEKAKVKKPAGENRYYPIKLSAHFSFDQLPTVTQMEVATRTQEEIDEQMEVGKQ
jgi:hypothetical protein